MPTMPTYTADDLARERAEGLRAAARDQLGLACRTLREAYILNPGEASSLLHGFGIALGDGLRLTVDEAKAIGRVLVGAGERFERGAR